MSGWNLPPGCTAADIERAAGADGPDVEGLTLKWLETNTTLTDQDKEVVLAFLTKLDDDGWNPLEAVFLAGFDSGHTAALDEARQDAYYEQTDTEAEGDKREEE